MARMYPEELIHQPDSSAEEKLFYELRDQLDDEFLVFYSVRFQVKRRARGSHYHRPGEIDYLIVHPAYGLLVLEVKGGRVQVENGSWFSIDRNDDAHALKKSPFDQAEANRFILGDKLAEMPLTTGRDYMISHAVVFPDISVGSNGFGLSAPRELVIDSLDMHDLQRAVRRAMGGASATRLQSDDVKSLIDTLAPTIHFDRVALGSRLREGEDSLYRMTIEQYEVLRQLQRNPRLAVAGCAGAGKTMLALEQARMLAAQGLRVLLTCYNRNLSQWLEERVRDMDASVSRNIRVQNFHAFAMDFSKRAGLNPQSAKNEAPDQNLFWAEIIPELVNEAADVLGPQFDAIVADEGQDFQEDWWWALTATLHDPDHSPFAIFYDDNQQIYGDELALPFEPMDVRLTKNCRNTQLIHEQVVRYYHGSTRPVSYGPHGTECEIIKPNGQRETDVVQRVLHRLVNEESILSEQIVILTPAGVKRSSFRNDMRLGNFQLTWGIPESDKEIRVSTIHSFKGLESSVVILAELEKVWSNGEQDYLFYVATSRAKSHLVIIGELPEPSKRNPSAIESPTPAVEPSVLDSSVNAPEPVPCSDDEEILDPIDSALVAEKLDIQYEKIPRDLAETPQWICLREESGSLISYRADHQVSIKDDNAALGVDLNTALRAGLEHEYDAVAFIPDAASAFTFVRVKNAFDAHTGFLKASAREYADGLQSYTEVARNDDDLIVIVRGDVVQEIDSDDIAITKSGRWIQLTGHLEDDRLTEIHNREEELFQLIEDRTSSDTPVEGTVKELRNKTDGKPVKVEVSTTKKDNGKKSVTSPLGSSGSLSDEQVIERAMNGAEGLQFRQLHAGNVSEHKNFKEATKAYCESLIRIIGPNEPRIGRIIKKSNLSMKEWDKPAFRTELFRQYPPRASDPAPPIPGATLPTPRSEPYIPGVTAGVPSDVEEVGKWAAVSNKGNMKKTGMSKASAPFSSKRPAETSTVCQTSEAGEQSTRIVNTGHARTNASDKENHVAPLPDTTQSDEVIVSSETIFSLARSVTGTGMLMLERFPEGVTIAMLEQQVDILGQLASALENIDTVPQDVSAGMHQFQQAIVMAIRAERESTESPEKLSDLLLRLVDFLSARAW